MVRYPLSEATRVHEDIAARASRWESEYFRWWTRLRGRRPAARKRRGNEYKRHFGSGKALKETHLHCLRQLRPGGSYREYLTRRSEKGSPGLRWRPPMAHQVLGHRRLRDLDAQLLQLPVNARRAPEGPPTSRYSPRPWRDGGSAAGPASNGGARTPPGRGRVGGGSCGRGAVRSLGHHGWESSRPGHRGGSTARGFRSVDA